MNKQLITLKERFDIAQKYFGWGRKKSGRKAVELAKKNSSSFLLLEDGFIRSIGLGDDEAFSIVKDDIGIYYDATAPSRLENIFKEDNLDDYLEMAERAISLIKDKKISKYNNGSLSLPKYLKSNKKKVLIIAQTKGDMSLKYGYGDIFENRDILEKALQDNPDSEIYLKVHPDVLAGKKESNIDIGFAKKKCKIILENIHPIVLLEAFDKIYTQTSQMGFEALLLGKETHIFGAPFYVGWSLENLIWHLDENKKKDILKRRGKKLTIQEVFTGAYILYSQYYNPIQKRESDIIDTINTISKQRDILLQNNGKLYFFGFSLWKRKNTLNFFKPLNQNKIFFCKGLDDALSKGLDDSSKIFIWKIENLKDIERFVKEKKEMDIKVFRVEDGFIRSLSLGSDLTKAYSLVVDGRGIYFDPSRESDLENILNSYSFDEDLLERARELKSYLIQKNISKYNIHRDENLNFDTTKKIVLVVGQVEDDASIIYGGDGIKNIELLERVRAKRADEFIIYKPHPDVLAGNRKGHIKEERALEFADIVIKDISLPSLLNACDELHTITSLSGFEGLIRGKKVYTYGMPFYAGWGLTIDERVCERRKREITIDELVASTYILYPRYISPKDGEFCEVEVLIGEIEQQKERYNNNLIYRWSLNSRNFISRKLQLLIKVILNE